MDKKERLTELICRFGTGSKSKFAALIGVTPGTVSIWLTRGVFDLELLYEKCEGVSARWLLTGEGEVMERDEERTRSDLRTMERMTEVMQESLRAKDEIIRLQRELLEKKGAGA